MSEPTPQGVDGAEDREQLVAYLDGELDAAACRELERRLAGEPGVQRELQRLQQAWDLLDRLPRAEVDTHFTRSTVEMIAVAAQEEAECPQGPPWRRWPRVWQAGLLAAAGLAGFALFRLAWPDANRQLLEDLPVLEHLEAYRQTPDLEFLRQLRDKKLVSEEPSDEP